MHTFTVTVAGGTTTAISATYMRLQEAHLILSDEKSDAVAMFVPGQWLKVVRS